MPINNGLPGRRNTVDLNDECPPGEHRETEDDRMYQLFFAQENKRRRGGFVGGRSPCVPDYVVEPCPKGYYRTEQHPLYKCIPDPGVDTEKNPTIQRGGRRRSRRQNRSRRNRTRRHR
jgi:hypothetical protein